MTAPTNSDIVAIEEALAAGPTEGEWMVQALNLSPHHDTGIRVRGESVSGYAAVLNTKWPHEKQREEQRANARWIATSNPARLRRVLDTMQAMAGALEACLPSIDPYSRERAEADAALALYEGKQ